MANGGVRSEVRRLEVRELEDGRRTCWGPMAVVVPEKELERVGFVRPRVEDGVVGREVVLLVPAVSGEGAEEAWLREVVRARGVGLLGVTLSWSDMSVK